MANLQGLFRIGRDAEVRFTPSGDPVATLALAYNYGKKADKTSQWIEAALWGKRAEVLAPYLLKGQQIAAVIDDAHIETYAKRDGGEGVKLVGRISNIEFASSKPQTAPAPAPKPQTQAAPPPHHQASSLADMDSDIPF